MLFIICTKSSVFSNRVATDEEKEDQILQQQNDNINSLEVFEKNQTSKFLKWKLQKTGKRKFSSKISKK
jgi:hypothetical protein